MRMNVAGRCGSRRPVHLGLATALWLGALPLLGGAAAFAQWGDGYQQPGNGTYYEAPPRRRPREAYYRDDGGYGRQPRAAPPQEAPRQFYWPWEDRPQPVAPPPERTYRAPRPRNSYSPAEAQRPMPAIKRRVRPARAPTPSKPAIAKTEPHVQIAVFGDSLADHLAKGLDDVFEDNADVAVIDRAKGDSGLVRQDVVDWPKVAQDYLQTNPKVRYAVVMLGANDRQPIRDGEETVDPLTDRWRTLYRARVDALIKVFTDRKLPLVWVGLPPVQSESLSRDLAAINDIVRDSVTKAGATYVDIWPGFVDDRDRYAASGPDPEGQIAKLRTADGVHFTKAGGRKLAHFADVELKRLMGTTPAPADQPSASVAPSGAPAVAAPSLDGTGPSTDTAAIDRQITAMLPSLPEPPGVPALPVKPAAGPVIPLSRTEVSPGGSLLSGRPRDTDNLGTVERTLLRGNAPMPQPGRADDFRWPPG
ncbi:DUF459 domain-containing protein [Methylobacterium sp. GC_Met_2]|uniref:SGNH/GDSL hydrolase family protein n=1 Tax=Methylobacterium sp. GC_Met_2 TaxID=2937376 RepID=UPI00226B7DC2|nr:DUF459 domain-containing protein [Methylobacterium sp. GC_Met_2]